MRWFALTSAVSFWLAWIAFRSRHIHFRASAIIPASVAFVATTALLLRYLGVNVSIVGFRLNVPTIEFVSLVQQIPWWFSTFMLIAGCTLNYCGEHTDNIFFLVVSYIIIALALISLYSALSG